jgi:hypothetical protein
LAQVRFQLLHDSSKVSRQCFFNSEFEDFPFLRLMDDPEKDLLHFFATERRWIHFHGGKIASASLLSTSQSSSRVATQATPRVGPCAVVFDSVSSKAPISCLTTRS